MVNPKLKGPPKTTMPLCTKIHTDRKTQKYRNSFVNNRNSFKLLETEFKTCASVPLLLAPKLPSSKISKKKS